VAEYDSSNGVNAAGNVANGNDDAAILNQAKKRLQMSMDALDDTRNSELDDLKFRAGSPDNQWQWPQDVLTARSTGNGSTINARPCLTINKLPQHVLQITNQQRQDRPSGKVIPVDDKADIEIAEVFEGIVRHIEYISDADVAYDTACDHQVSAGEGYWRIITKYVDEGTFDQEIYIERIKNLFSVNIDPMIKDPCGSDAKWGIISQDMLKSEFEELYPNATPVDNWGPQGVGDQGMATWLSTETIRIAEYFYIDTDRKKLCQYPPVPGIMQGGNFLADSNEAKQYKAMGIKPLKERTTEINIVRWCKLNGHEILEKKVWAGKYIPIVRVVGNEFEIEGRVYISGIVRNAKDAQRMYNYWTSQEAEMLALAPKAPYVGAAGQFEGFEEQWKTANIQNWPYLEYNPTVEEGLLVPPPQRTPPPLPQAGLIQAKLGAADDIKGTTGQYDASLGQQSNERSGKAILAREKQADTGTFHYQDNLGRAIRYSTRILLDLIPKIYDTNRVARIIGLDGQTEQVQLNPEQPEAVVSIKDQATGAAMQKIYNLNVGRYDVAVAIGPGYATKRQEAVENMGLLIQTSPELWKVIGDLLVKNMDWPGAQEMARRLRATIPPDVLAAGDGDEDSPKVAQLNKQLEELVQHIQAQQQLIDNMHKSVEAQSAMNEHFKADILAYKADTERMKMFVDVAATPDGEGTLPPAFKALLQKTMQEMLTAPSLEAEEPPPLEFGETHMQGNGGMPPQLGA